MRVLFATRQVSSVLGLRLADGSDVVVKVRPDENRAASCLSAQRQAARLGFRCPRPLTGPVVLGADVVHAEELVPGGEVLSGDSDGIAGRYGEVFARLSGTLAAVTVPPPLPNPRWVRWDHDDGGLWPAVPLLDERDQRRVPGFVVAVAERVRHRLLGCGLPNVLGHADFEAQNLRWREGRLRVVHDWDSLAWQPEAALAGAASGAYPRGPRQPPGLAPVGSSEAFLDAYQRDRGREFDADELEVAWAASLWPVAHNARWEALLGGRAELCSAVLLRDQAAERLRRAGA